MTLQAPASVDVRPANPAGARIEKWRRGIGTRQVRLACGLVMFSYIFSHFFNHALGNFSYATMEAWLRFHVWWWRIPVVNFTLYAAAAIHFSLGLWALYQRRHFRYTVIEIAQLVLGLNIPLLIASHLGVVRLGGLTVFTALGDAVNVAARLQDMTKALNCTVVISEEVRNKAGIAAGRLTQTAVPIRGQPMAVCTVADATMLISLLEQPAATAPGRE